MSFSCRCSPFSKMTTQKNKALFGFIAEFS